MDALLYGLTIAWGTEVTSSNRTPDAAAVSFAICDVVSTEPARLGGQEYACAHQGSKTTPKKKPTADSGSSMALDEDHKGDHGTAGNATCPGSEEVGDDDEGQPEMTQKKPNYKNAPWLRKRPSMPRWTQQLYQILEGPLEAD